MLHARIGQPSGLQTWRDGRFSIAPPVRRHVRTCDRCRTFRKQLRDTNKALAAVFPIGPLLFLKKSFLAHLGTTDKGIVLYRRLLVDAINKNEAGEKPMMVGSS